MTTPTSSLLAIDLGLRCGLAVYTQDGLLRSYQSQHFGTRDQLKRGVYGVMRGVEGLSFLMLEGDRNLATFWTKLADKWEIPSEVIGAEVWREQLLLPRERQSGQLAKARAGELARQVIALSGLPAPTSLRHDAAEAILIGLHAVLELGWLPQLPAELVPH